MKPNRFVALAAITLLVVGLLAVAVGSGIGIASATGADTCTHRQVRCDDAEPPITGDALTQASAAALDHTGAGRVTETEAGDEDGYYEVEVTLDDGRQVDVHLDENFQVLSQEADADHPNDQDGPNDN